nr:uncharacterized protein LOC111428573 isoform X2 [Onthophagus taurus]
MDQGMEIGNEHQLWVNLSSLTEGNIGGVLPKLIQEMLGNIENENVEQELFEITLPSDDEWRNKMYQKLLLKQKLAMSMDQQIPEEKIVLHEWNILPNKNEKVFCAPDAERLAKKVIKTGPGPITWTVSDIAKASCLLQTPPLKITFQDEQEMRRVYTLIYDVFRYKSVLHQTLMDTAFFFIFPELMNDQARVYLLLYDMYHRSFKKREVQNQAVANKMFAECGLSKVEEYLWKQRVKLAAAIARLRIEKSALRLNELLPGHLRDEKTTIFDTSPVTCWVNLKKLKNKKELNVELISNLGLTEIDNDLTPGPGHYKWDPHCPHFLVLHPTVRSKLAQSTLVKKHKLIVQSKSFCVGPATFGKIISDLQLTGSVVQTHVNSPRTVAYLATLLSQNGNIKKLMAFSAGNRKKEYETYFHDLGMKNIVIYSEKLIDVAPDANYLEEVIAVFATPPNSYSAVTDPIDLVCGRGGDLSVLEILTEAEETKQTKQRVTNILEEQKKTLRFAMSRPQIQFVLYETHSEIDAENNAMVDKAMKEVNKLALIHHASLQGKIKAQSVDAASIQDITLVDQTSLLNKNLLEAPSDVSLISRMSAEESDSEERLRNVVVPDCDVFTTADVPPLCPNIKEQCTNISREGCFLALMQRKTVTNMDNKYMIEMAESRGLFGKANPDKKTSKGAKTKKPVEAVSSPTNKPKKKVKQIEIERIAAPTLASIQHSKACTFSTCQHCMRHSKDLWECNYPTKRPSTTSTPAKQWWSETTRHLTNLRTSLVKQKVLPPKQIPQKQQSATSTTSKAIANTFIHTTQRIDEIVAKTSKSSCAIPLYPKLRLTRKPNRKDKVPCPMTVTFVKFNGTGHRALKLNC